MEGLVEEFVYKDKQINRLVERYIAVLWDVGGTFILLVRKEQWVNMWSEGWTHTLTDP
jgi:hypothetical protein